MRRRLCLAILAAKSPLFASEIAIAPPVVVPAEIGYHISAATDGVDVLAVWPNDSRLRYALLRRSHGGGAVAIGSAVSWAWPRIAVADDVVFVTGMTNGRIVLASYTADLQPRWPAPLELAAGWEAEIAAEGRNAVVVWTDREHGVFGTRVTPEGTARPFNVIATSVQIFDLQVASGGGATVVAYSRIASEEPYLGALRVFVHFFPAPPRRHASAP